MKNPDRLMENEDDFKPELLVGKMLFFQCQTQEIPPSIFRLGKIIWRSGRVISRGWTYSGRKDLVKYEVMHKGKISEHIMDYREIMALIKTGIYTDNYGLKYEILKDEQ